MSESNSSNVIFDGSLFSSIVMAFIYACGMGLLIGFISTPFIDIVDRIFTFFDSNALIYVQDKYDPFRVALESGILSSFLTLLFVIYFERKKG
jgi:hypothetical protein